MKKSRSSPLQGFALVIVLVMVVLLTAIVVAMLSRSTNHQSVEDSASERILSEELAKSGADYFVGLMRNEIIVNSDLASTNGFNVYIPKDGTNMVPSRQLRSAALASNTNFVNLFKQTSANFGAGSSVGSEVASRDGRLMTTNRWNVPKLLAGEGFVSANTLPTWTYVARTGVTNVTAISLPMKDPSSSSYIVGRLAANIYAVDGLLDVNVAGYATAAGTNATRKGSLVWADLSALPGTDDTVLKGAAGLPQWRFTGDHSNLLGLVSGTGTGIDSTAGEPGGWLVPNTGGANNSQDNKISSRQELIKMAGLGTYGFNTNSLPYLTHWTRAVASPSFQRNAPNVLPLAQGGNDAYGKDDAINPSLIDTRVDTAFTRRTYDPKANKMRDRLKPDGTPLQAEIGEPLLKYRFPLRDLDLVTRTATASASQNNPIYALFGLSRSSASSSWTYGHGNSSGAIYKLSEVAAQGREPDFVELLKAAISVGSIGKASGLVWLVPGMQTNRDILDRSVDYQIIQIAANIIDQYDADGYPTGISFNGNNFSGIENLPYFSGVRIITPGWKKTGNPNCDLSKMLAQPEVWNPHANINVPSDRPSNFRVIAQADNVYGLCNPGADDIGFGGTYSTTVWLNSALGADWWETTTDAGKIQHLNVTPTNSEIDFTAGSGSFLEPTYLTASNASVGPGNTLGKFRDYYGTYYTGNVLGIFLSVIPTYIPGEIANNSQFQIVADPGFNFQLQYQDGGNWITYCDAGDMDLTDNFRTSWDKRNIPCFAKMVFPDPRTARFGAPGGSYGDSSATSYVNADLLWGASLTQWPQLNLKYKVWSWSNLSEMQQRGFTMVAQGGLGSYWGDLTQNLTSLTTWYKDADGQQRRAVGAYAAGTDGLPMITGNATSRPIILNRPFRSIGELGYVFKGTPWKNLDFFTAESGDTALLDIFSVYDSPDTALVSGRINPNTAAIPALTAVLQGILREDSDNSSTMPSAEATAVATAIRAYITSTAGGPLKNKAELVGKYTSSGYVGISTSLTSALTGTDPAIARRRLASIRSLADSTEVRTWNLMIDVIAQTGKFASASSNLSDFSLAGETRLWVFVALDRLTGKIVDISIERVTE